MGSLVGPGAWIFSVNPYKNFPIREQASLQIGAQIENLFNHPNYDLPNAIINRPNGGLIQNVRQARRVQVSMGAVIEGGGHIPDQEKR
ncbi:MAG: hypothetical protein HXY20_12575 [Acidobacteria bacterium]|nr:hypothetical protein [Acidobacteriota bacterium]